MHDQKSVPKLKEMVVSTSFNQFQPVLTSFTQLCVIGSMPLEHYTGILESWNSGILESSHFKHMRTDFLRLAQFSIGMSNKKNHTFLIKAIFKKYIKKNISKYRDSTNFTNIFEPTVPPGNWT